MELKKFIENFVSQFDETDTTLFQANTEFKTLEEWSSFMALSIISMVDEEYDVPIKGDDIRKSTKIEDLYNTVAAKK
jgi:acyl carrier protein